MIPSKIHQWTLLCYLCFIKPFLANAKSSYGVKYQYEKPVSKTWSSWMDWSECSRSCGGGVRTRTRHCRVRENGRKFINYPCQGENDEHELCSTQACLPRDKEFLELQCSKQNGILIEGKRIYDWLPYQYGSNPCQLQCWSRENFVIHSFGKVIDGTKCSHLDSEEAVCLNGRCSPIDCSGKIGSLQKRDGCGVCGGKNSTCIQYKNTFWRRPRSKAYYSHKDHHYEYDEVFSLPAGATNILVKEASRTNFLALADQRGNYFINGNWKVDSPGKFEVNGSVFTYNRTWDGSETFTSSSPTKQKLVVSVLGNGDMPTVHYEYWHSPAASSPHHTDLSRERSKLSGPVTKLQGYHSFYHRNEILKSVPSWSIKRFSSYKNPLNILSLQNQQSIYSIGTSTGSGAQPYDHADQLRSSQLKNSSLNKEWADEIVSLDNAGRPTGTSAHGGSKNQLVEYGLQRERSFDIEATTEKTISSRKEKSEKKNHTKRKRKSNNENCPPCPKSKRQTKHFCLSDFVLRAVVLSSEKQQESVRYEVEVVRSFKNKIPILPREFLWTSDLCHCPRLGLGREVIIMGKAKTVQRESRLVVDADSFVRKYTSKRARTLLRLIRDQNTLCKRHSVNV